MTSPKTRQRQESLCVRKQVLLTELRAIKVELDGIREAGKLRARKAWPAEKIRTDILRRLRRGEPVEAVGTRHGKTVAQVKGYAYRFEKKERLNDARWRAKAEENERLARQEFDRRQQEFFDAWPVFKLTAPCASCGFPLKDEPKPCAMCERCRDAHSLSGAWHTAAMSDRVAEAQGGVPKFWPCWCHDCNARSLDEKMEISRRLGMSIDELFYSTKVHG